MAIKFQCKNCGKDIAVRFLKVGEAAECRNCGASNAVPDSAEEISDETAERMIKAPVFKSAKSIGNRPTKSLPIVKALRTSGVVLIGYGVIAGIFVLMVLSYDMFDADREFSLGVILSALGITFYFCGLGAICFGIAKVLELLNK